MDPFPGLKFLDPENPAFSPVARAQWDEVWEEAVSDGRRLADGGSQV